MSSCVRSAPKSTVTLAIDDFGSYKDNSGVTKQVKRFTWTNKSNTTIQVLNYGGIITSIKIADKQGKVEDIITGFDTIEEYRSPKQKFFGATVGRVANRIAKGKFSLDGVDYTLALNNGVNHLHGGIQGFDKVLWNYYVKGTKLILTYLSPHLEEGYPGDLLATVTFELTANNDFQIDYKAVVTQTTPINLTNHSYFNLAGHGAGAAELYKHEITINADRVTELHETIPTGKFINVGGTAFDLRVPTVLGNGIKKTPGANGYDINFCITRTSAQELGFVARAVHPPSGRVMEIFSNQPGVQFYTGNALPEDDSITGKGGVYKKHGAFCLETQKYPDAVHHDNFPDVLVRPGEEYYQICILKFSVQN